MNFKKPNLLGKDEDGLYEGRIEQIGTGKRDLLMISNRKPNAWIFSVFTGYRQLGTFNIRSGKFKEGDWVIVKKVNGKIVRVKHARN